MNHFTCKQSNRSAGFSLQTREHAQRVHDPVESADLLKAKVCAPELRTRPAGFISRRCLATVGLALLAVASRLSAADSRSPQELEAAAARGSAEAQCDLGYRYEYPQWIQTPAGNRLPPPNMIEAVRWYRKAADQNWVPAQYYLALAYGEGHAIDKDEEAGLEWMRKAADRNYVRAVIELAGFYTRGIGRPRSDSDRPIALFERAVALDPTGQYADISEAYEQLILRHEYGIGTERDLVTAAEWQCRAALAGLSSYSLAEPDLRRPFRANGYSSRAEPGRSIIELTIPDQPNRSEAFTWTFLRYLRAAKGNAAAAAQIGETYLTGIDVPKSAMKAWLWFTLAAGDNSFKDGLARCQRAMTPDELGQARSHLADFKQRLSQVGQHAR